MQDGDGFLARQRSRAACREACESCSPTAPILSPTSTETSGKSAHMTAFRFCAINSTRRRDKMMLVVIIQWIWGFCCYCSFSITCGSSVAGLPLPLPPTMNSLWSRRWDKSALFHKSNVSFLLLALKWSAPAPLGEGRSSLYLVKTAIYVLTVYESDFSFPSHRCSEVW